MIEIRADVERESMARDPTRNANPDCTDLLGADPRPRQHRDAPRRASVVATRPNHHFLEVAHVLVDITSIWPEVEDGITDELTRTVIRDVSSTTGLVDRDPELGKALARCNDISTRNF